MLVKETISIMSIKEGHSEMQFDPKDEDDVRKMKHEMKKLLEKGYYAYALIKKTGKYVTLQPKDLKDISDDKIEKFLLVKAKKRMVTPPTTSG